MTTYTAEAAEAARVAEAEAARVADEEEARLAEEERAREEAWDRLIESGETDGMPWADVPAKERENYTVCWNWTVMRASIASGGNGNGWVTGPNTIDEVGMVTQEELRSLIDDYPPHQGVWEVAKTIGNNQLRDSVCTAPCYTSSGADCVGQPWHPSQGG